MTHQALVTAVTLRPCSLGDLGPNGGPNAPVAPGANRCARQVGAPPPNAPASPAVGPGAAVAEDPRSSTVATSSSSSQRRATGWPGPRGIPAALPIAGLLTPARPHPALAPPQTNAEQLCFNTIFKP